MGLIRCPETSVKKLPNDAAQYPRRPQILPTSRQKAEIKVHKITNSGRNGNVAYCIILTLANKPMNTCLQQPHALFT